MSLLNSKEGVAIAGGCGGCVEAIISFSVSRRRVEFKLLILVYFVILLANNCCLMNDDMSGQFKEVTGSSRILNKR